MSSSTLIIYKTAAKPVIGLKVVDDAGAARDITGWSLTWLLGKLNVPGQGQLLTASATVVDGPNGICEVTLTATSLSTIPAGAYTHELRRTNAGDEEILGQGPAVVRASLSQ